MESKDTPKPVFNFKYTIARKDIQEFVNNLHELQESYLNAAVEKVATEKPMK